MIRFINVTATPVLFQDVAVMFYLERRSITNLAGKTSRIARNALACCVSNAIENVILIKI
ncbi:MAG: hypothetical protein P4N41_18075 [Negativicutes bacterium]|nr:hypothetical protein [Negativicutes bacterium]